MTDWRANLKQASFRGVPFYTKSTSGDVGRRTAVHEYPQRDTAYVEDLGRKGRPFTLESYVLGQNYMAARDALIAALEQPGAGSLVHPTRGTILVALTSPARISESADEGGMARFSLSFIETVADNLQPNIQPNTPAMVGAAADAAERTLSNDFSITFTVAGPSFLETAAAAVLNTSLDLLSAVGQVTNNTALAEMMHSAQTISGSLAMMMTTPALLASSIQTQIQALAGLVQTPQDAWDAMQDFLGRSSSLSYVPLTTPSRIQQSLNQTAVSDLVRRTVVVEAARASSQLTFSSYNAAQAALATLTALLDAELESNTHNSAGDAVPLNDDVYDALLELRMAVARDISARGANLAKLTSVTLPRTMPALVAAYRIYGDCTMDADIVARNNIRHPGFLPGGIPLEILA